MRSLRPLLKFVAAFGLVSTLAACDPGTGFDFTSEPSVNMRDMSYKAADVLVTQTQKTMPAGTPILLGTLSDVNHMETSTPLGRMITEQVGARMAQRGLNVSDVKIRNAINVKENYANAAEAGEYFLSRDTSVLKGEQDVGAVVTGTYVQAKNEVLVNLRMIDARTSRIIAATDYRLPANSDVRSLLQSDGGSDFESDPNPWGWH